MLASLKDMSHTMPQQSNENAAISWRWLHFCCADVFWLVGLATLCTHRGTLAASSTVLPRVGGDNAPWQRAQWSDARTQIPSAPHPGRSAGYLSSTQLASALLKASALQCASWLASWRPHSPARARSAHAYEVTIATPTTNPIVGIYFRAECLELAI